MAAIKFVPRTAVFSFQNTGREHPKTLDFIERVEGDLGVPIVRLEWRAPPRGEPPRFAKFELVSHSRLSRKGEPFRDLLECLAAYRAREKGAEPIAPWARSRICTGFLKIKTQDAYCASLGWTQWTQVLGLRADEPSRIARMRERNEIRGSSSGASRRRWLIDEEAPLDVAGIVKADVLQWWRGREYDLDLPEYLGNCTGCFMKDERDLADALLDPVTDAAWWIKIEEDFAPMRRGRSSSYADVFREAPARMKIRESIREGKELPDVALPRRRLLAIVNQEQSAAREAFSCACEGAYALADDEDGAW